MKMRHRVIIAALLLGSVLPAAAFTGSPARADVAPDGASAAVAPPAPAPTKGVKAGSITALLPIARIERGAGKAKVTTDAKRGDDINWNDNIRTERGGRARITLSDQSILSLGSQAELRIVKHDARSQQTALALQYGRIRAEVAKVTRQGGSFELRTPTAVAGVIGTDFGTDASTPGVTTFICISGLVQVSNSDPNIAGSVQCAPGLTTTVTAGKAPTPPQNATPEQIQQLIQDTEPAIIAAMSPVNALPGAALDVTITGTKLASVKNVSATGSGLTTSLVGSPTDTAVTVHVVVAADAQPGPRMITLSKSSGAASAAMFTVLSPPNAAQGDPKKAYLDMLAQEGQTTRGGLTSYLAAVQQVADLALQELQQANQANLNINDAQNAFSTQLTSLQNALTSAGQQIDDGVAQASTTFQQQYDVIYQALLQRHPDGTPDDQFNQALQALFASINGSLGNNFTTIRNNLSSVVTSTNTNIAQVQQTWMSTLSAASNPPVPVVNSTERSIDLGAAFGGSGITALDAGNSKASGGASIVSYKWVLCDPSYKPAQFGVPLPGTATAGCNPISGYSSSSSDFAFNTCNLASADYIARVTVVDSNSVSAAMDVKVHVLPATYDDPATRVRNLAQAYMTLQPNNFLSFFDETGFSGFTALSENVRNTFPLLASMQINPRVSQAAITCNDATVRADWVQNYTYKQNPDISFNQTEQLSMRMLRTPGKGWNIVDFQGDNGTVQGQLPGPAVTDTAQPDLIVAAVYPTYVGASSTNAPVPPGAQNFTANIQNVGGADFTAATVVRFQLRDANNNPIGNAVDVNLPAPLAAGAAVNVQAQLDVPATIAIGATFQILANVNPACLPEANCDASNQLSENLVLGSPVNFQIVSVAFAGHNAPYTGINALQLGETTTVDVVVRNTGTATVAGNITLVASCVPKNTGDTTSCSGGGNPTATIAAPAAGQSVTANLPVDFNGMIPGSFTGNVALTTAIAQGTTADDTLGLTFDVMDFSFSVQGGFVQQYILPATGQNLTVALQITGTTPFAMPVGVSSSPPYSGVTFSPATANVNGAQTYQVNAAAGTAAGLFSAVASATNRGVTHTASVQPFAVIVPQIDPTSTFLNDANNPLFIQRGGSQTVNLKLSGPGPATIVPPTSTLGFTTTINPTTSVPTNGTFDMTVTAAPVATSVVTPLVVSAQLPFTNPVLTVTYTLYVKADLPDLQVVSATPATTFSPSTPWFDGLGTSFAVVIKNNGGVTSAGNEAITITVDGLPAGTGTLVSPLAPGASQQVTVHALAPDVHGNTSFAGSGSVKVKVDSDPAGDVNYTDNAITFNVATANWHFTLEDTAPVQVITSAGGGSTIAHFSGAIDGSSFSSYPGLNFVPSQGQVSGSFTVANFTNTCAGATSNTVFCATIGTTNGTLQAGTYFAQVIVSLSDPVTGHTTQRQATVPLQVNTGGNGAVPSLASSANNCSGTSCSGTTGSTLQINGGLTEQFSVTLSMTCGALAPAPCSGTADLAIHDASNTQTTPLGSTTAVSTGTPLLLRVGAALDPNGNVITGPASGYAIGINGIQATPLLAAAPRSRAVSPDPVGTPVPFSINVGDLGVTASIGANNCSAIPATGTPVQMTVQWNATGGFNAPSISYQWEDGNHSPVAGSPLSFSNTSGTVGFSGGYSPVTLSLTNTNPTEGAVPYFLAVTISSSTSPSTATKYFPFYFDLSQAQSFCGAISAVRTEVHGSWSKTGAIGPLSTVVAPRSSVRASDVHIATSDVSFLPSMPKVGDAVQVRFRARNDGDADATGIPIALQINGVTVASDTFDVPKGRTVLGGLTWTATADVARRVAASDLRRPAVKGKVVDPDTAAANDDTTLLAGTVQLQAAVVVDPQHVTKQKTTVEKSASLSHLTLRGTGTAASGTPVAANSQRILIELEDGACVGLRLSSGGTMPCGSADLEITIGDLAKSLLSFDSLSGVGEVGTSFEAARRASRSAVRYSGQAAAMSGHTYSVQLANGNTATVNVESVRNPAELDAKAQALFRAGAARIMRNMGDSSTPGGPGDLTGNATHATVFIVLNVQGM